MNGRTTGARACRIAGVVVFGAFMLCGVAPAAAEEWIYYEVQQGDTLYDLSERYLMSAEDWRLLANANSVRDPLRLVPGSRLRMPASRLKGVAQPALALYVRGDVELISADGKTQRRLAAGERVHEGERIRVGAASFASLRLHDGSELQLQANTAFMVEQLRELERVDRSRTMLQLDKGRIDSNVARQRKGSRFEVRTPGAVAGVRGTRFGVTVASDGHGVSSDVVEGRVVVTLRRAGAEAEAEISAGQGVVATRASRKPIVRALLPAPDLSAIAPLYERLPFDLAFAPVPEAAAFRVQIAEDAQFTRVRHDNDAANANLAVGGLEDGEYFLSVRAIDRDGLVGGESIRTFRVKTTPLSPLAQAPAHDATVGHAAVELRCTEVPGAAGYRFDITHHGKPIALSGSDTPTCRYSVEPAGTGVYEWRVATLEKNADGRLERGPFNDASRFNVVPMPLAPEPEIESTDQVSMHWAAQPDTRFVIEVSDDAAFESVLSRYEVELPQLRFALPSMCRPYYLRLQSIDRHGIRSPFSAPRIVSASGVVCTSDGTPVGLSDGTVLRGGYAGRTH